MRVGPLLLVGSAQLHVLLLRDLQMTVTCLSLCASKFLEDKSSAQNVGRTKLYHHLKGAMT